MCGIFKFISEECILELKTARLRIIPLRIEELGLLIEDAPKVDEALKLASSGKALDDDTRQAMQELYDRAVLSPADYLWSTQWQIVLTSENRSIGGACFKGAPNQNGEVEIGYGLSPDYRGYGYMKEAASALCRWALEQPDVTSVVAETDKDNLASQKVLQHCGMIFDRESDEGFFWHMEREHKLKIRFENREHFKVYGYAAETSLDTNDQDLTRLWQHKNDLLSLQNDSPSLYGVMWYTEQHRFFYLLGFPVTEYLQFLEGMVFAEIPAARFAVAAVPEGMSAVTAWTEFFEKELPAHKFTPDTEHGKYFEYYTPNGSLELWTPVKPISLP